MSIQTKRLKIRLKEDGGMADITGKVQKIVRDSGLSNGIAVCFVPGSTGCVTTMEWEPGLQKDLPKALENVAPSGLDYEHHKMWGDDNGRSHVRASLIGPSCTVPFENGKLIHGRWQQLIAINWDTRTREREIVVQLIGE